MKPEFSVTILCKPYVKHYLTQNYGDPVNMYREQNSLLPFFRLLLDKTTKYKQEKRLLTTKTHSECLTIVLSEDDFNRAGYEISRTHMAVFNKEVESRFKFLMYSIVSLNFSLSGNLGEAIEKFTHDFDIPEDVWPHESIRKTFDRHAQIKQFDFKSTISESLTKKLLEQLSELGTISPTTIKEYENNTKRPIQHRRYSQSMGYSVFSHRNPKTTGNT